MILKDNNCVSDFECYELCEKGQCTKVSIDINNQYCIECKKSYFLYKENCITFINNTCECSQSNEKYFRNSDRNNLESCRNLETDLHATNIYAFTFFMN